VNSHTRKQILNTRIKTGWVICKVDDYIHVKDAPNVADTTIGMQTAEEKRHALSIGTRIIAE
jgi:hypothetical protein